MRESVIHLLEEIEAEYSIIILHACDVGSRAWGLASENSDYDVRFMYIHKREYYLGIDAVGIGKKKDTIELPIQDTLDVNGWDITKALKLFRKSNPSLLERLHSNVTYYETTHVIKKMRKMESTVFDAKSCLHHYLNMAKKNYQKCLQTEQDDIKDYLNVLRPILLACWIEEKNTFPSLDFQSLVENRILEGPLKADLHSLIICKRTGIGTFPVTTIHPFIESEITRLEIVLKDLPKREGNFTNLLDKLFQDTLMEAWDNSKQS